MFYFTNLFCIYLVVKIYTMEKAFRKYPLPFIIILLFIILFALFITNRFLENSSRPYPPVRGNTIVRS
jgi:hypothetical protein